ncbi:MAG TPA: hypothetical protein VFD31_06815, partial [Thermoleophilaceae bacterium]|nr:hypothetical protein [Thermoleophilaceae bacterium]
LVGEAAHSGATFKAKIDLVESLGSELYVHFSTTTDQKIESEELRELAEDAGAGEVPGGGQEGQIVARLDTTSKASAGQELELWLDATKIKLFDPGDGHSLTASGNGKPAEPSE